MSVELVVFDWDGTLMDSAHKIVGCFKRAFVDFELPARADEDIRATIGLSVSDAVATLYPELEPSLRQRVRERYSDHWIQARQRPVDLFAGALDVLAALQEQGLMLAVATGKSASGLRRDLETTGLASVFHSTRCADQANSKPDPQMLLDIMSDLDTDADSTVMVGDTSFDLEMARRAGTRSIAVTYGVHRRSRLLEFGPSATLDAIDELPSALLELN